VITPAAEITARLGLVSDSRRLLTSDNSKRWVLSTVVDRW